jgi:carbon starvation protein CstA
MRQWVKIACLVIVALGVVVFTLLMSNLIKPTPWTAAAVTAVFPALILAGILLGNDTLRRHGFSDSQIPTTKRNLARSMFTTFAFGLATGTLAIVAIYFLWK